MIFLNVVLLVVFDPFLLNWDQIWFAEKIKEGFTVFLIPFI